MRRREPCLNQLPPMHPAPLVLRGITLSFRADPFEVGPEAAFVHEADGAVLMRDGLIADAGPAAGVIKRHPGIPVEHHPNAVIMAGFVDCHAHYPQTGVIASYGAQLIEWLEKYTFPAEIAFADSGQWSFPASGMKRFSPVFASTSDWCRCQPLA